MGSICRIRYIEPNDIYGQNDMRFSNNTSTDNIVFNPEKLIMGVDLQVVCTDRMNCGQRDYDPSKPNTNNFTTTRSIFGGSYISPLASERDLTTDYINMSFDELKNKGYSGQEMLSIQSIDIKYSSRMMPTVIIKFVDIKGYALMMPSEHELYTNYKHDDGSQKYSSIFKAFFRFPYPRFLLTVKGFFGGSVTYSLSIVSFKTSFDDRTGNFNIEVKFSGYETSFISDLPFNFIILSPYIGGNGGINSFWRKEDFLVADKSNKSTNVLPTFVEFINKMSNMISFYDKSKEGKTGNSIVDNDTKGKDQLSKILKVESAFGNFLSKGYTSNPFLHLRGDYYNAYFVGETFNVTKYASEYYRNYTSYINEFCNGVGDDGNITSDGLNTPSMSLNTAVDYKESDFTDGKKPAIGRLGNGTYVYDNSLGIQMAKRKIISSGIYKNAIFYKTDDVKKWIANEKNKANGKRATSEEINKIISKMADDLEENLGMRCTIRNMMRIIFAHVDCFLGSIYDLLNRIYKNPDRTLKKYGLYGDNGQSMMGVYTDLNNRGNFKSTDKLPPFTGFYRDNEQGTKEEVFPGDLEDFSTLEEVSYINDFVNALFATKKYLNDSEYSALNAMVGMLLKRNTETKAITVDNEAVSKFRLSMYRSLKTLYDRWLSSMTCSNFKLQKPQEEKEEMLKKLTYGSNSIDKDISFFSNFIYVDAFFNDISDRLIVDPKYFYDSIIDQNNGKINANVYSFISSFLQKNHMSMITVPVFNNFYSADNINNIFRLDSTMKRMANEGTTFLCLYSYEPSKIASTDSEYEDDNVDISDTGNFDVSQADRSKLFEKVEEVGIGANRRLEINIPAFGVTFARQNQTIFKTIKVSMDNGRLTNNAIQKMMKLTSVESNGIVQHPVTAAQDTFSIFSNYQYQCTVEMMGCMDIMPGMYFQLNNIPMFKGAYMITSVEHNIKAGDITTKFSGLRISKISVPFIDHVSSLNSYMNKLNEELRPTYEIERHEKTINHTQRIY